MHLEFEKWQACANDFAVFWLPELDFDLIAGSLRRQAPVLCDRHRGIGGDGLLLLKHPRRGSAGTIDLEIINSDGSLAANCGNGLRCAAMSVRARQRAEPGSEPVELVTLSVQGQTLTCRVLGPEAEAPLIAVDLGVPLLGSQVPWKEPGEAAVRTALSGLGLKPGDFALGVGVVGNPHVVITLESADDFGSGSPVEPVGLSLLRRIGPMLQGVPPFAAGGGINVHVVTPKELTSRDRSRAGRELGQPVAEAFTAYVYERGAGETMACGTGAGVIGALAVATGLVASAAWIAIDMPGGRLYVRHAAPDETIELAGPAVPVYRGTIEV